MIIFFEIIKIIFFLLSIGMGLLFLRWYYYMPDATFTSLSNIIMPAYLLVVGIMIGYITVLYYKTKMTEPVPAQYWVKAFVWGLVVGIMFSIFYIFAQ
jgi:hypothetical protein